MKRFEKYIEYKKGSYPLIISIPHGGTIKLKGIPKRTNGVLGIDKYTIQLGKNLIKQIETKHKKGVNIITPYYVISKIHRSIIDLNRNEDKAYINSSKIAHKLYNLYHDKMFEYIKDSIKNFGRSLLIDIHGFETEKRPQGFRDVDIILGTNNLKSLFPHSVPKKEWSKNIRGKLIINLMELEIPIAPGHPRRKEYVLKGGFITKKYGAQNITKSQSIQIEFSDRIRILNMHLQNKVLEMISKVLIDNF